MSTFTIRISSSATNPAGTAYGQQPDQGAPSYFDVVISGSSDAGLPNGVYDGYCLNPQAGIQLVTDYTAQNYAGNTAASYVPIGFNNLSQAQVDQINWLLSQNFTSDAKYAGQFNYGEVQTAIWKLLDFSDAAIAATPQPYLTDNGRNTVSADDVSFLVSSARAAVASGNGVVPTDAFFSTVIDPAGNVQPLIIQLQNAKLGNFVWEDIDRDGVQDANEAGVDRVVVELYDGTGKFIASTITGDDFSTAAVEKGYYQFAGLKAGDYQVKFIAPSYDFTVQDSGAPGANDGNDSDANVLTGLSQTVTLAAGQSNQTVDAGLVQKPVLNSAISGFVYSDTDNDGIKDPGEVGLGGVTVLLTGSDNQGNLVNKTTTTNPDGSYSFTGLAAGIYTVTEVDQPAGYLDGRDTAGAPGGGTAGNEVISNIVLPAGVTSSNNNFGELLPAKISGFVYEDVGDDGVKGGAEVGIPGVTVTLTGTDDAGNSVTRTATTGADGSYAFENLRPGNYTVTESQPAAYVDGKDTVGNGGGTAGNDVISNIPLSAGEHAANNNFGELPKGQINGFVYCDDDNDGIKDAGEVGLGGVTVTLTGTNDLGQPVNTAVQTNPDGSYSFTGLRPGTYTVTETTQPADKLDGKDTAGTPGGGTAGNEVISNIVLTPGLVSNGNNFGEILPAKISGFVYEDVGDDGVKGGAEVGIPGVTVTLTGTDDAGNSVTRTATTGADGSYAFENLRPGNYTVTESQPAAYVDGKDTVGNGGGTAGNDVISNIPLSAGEHAANNNFGELPKGQINGFVYCDDDNDGIKDAGEVGLGGVTVTLTGTNDLGQPVNTAVQTNPDGSYSFTGLRPGTYTVTETTQPADKLDGKDTAGTPGGGTAGNEVISNIVLTPGLVSNGNNFGEILPAKISGFVYEDVGDDGVKGGAEVGIPGVTVTLTGTDDAGNSVTRTATTGADGSYAFENLRPGNYTVTESQPAAYVDGKDTVGNGGGTAGNDVISNIPLSAGEHAANNNFGELPKGQINGFVYNDADDDGIKDAGEAGLGGVTVRLTGTDDLGNPVNTTVQTNPDGSYSFTGLRPGTYTVTELTQPAGYLDGKDTAGTTPGSVSANEVVSNIVLGAGQTSNNNNFGEILPAKISGFVYEDVGDDGVKGGAEVGIPGVTVTLTGTDDAGNSVTRTATTGADGSYAFENLRPGNYTVTESQPAAYVDGKDTVGNGGGTAGNDVISNIPLSAGEHAANNNFGELPKGQINGFVYCDDDNDGIKDAGEVGLGGVTVTLTGTNDLGQPVNTAVQTNPDGSYSFTGLRPGTYTVTETTQPADKLDGKDTAGTPGGGTAGNEVISNIVLTPGLVSNGNNFGEILPAKISGFVYEDVGDDGVKGGAEVGIPGVTVTLTGTDDAGNSVTRTATTGADGSYAFENLRPGNYTVTESQPAAYVDGKDTVGNGGGTAGNDVISNIPLSAGEHAANNNFGELPKGQINGFVYCDDDNDGIKDAGEVGLGGVTVTLTGTNDLGQPVNTAVQTNPDGSYSFTGLRPGTYTVTETTQPADKLDGKDTAGTPGGGTAGNEVISNIVLTPGLVSNGNNFGEILPAKISGFVYEDAGDDGVKGAGEAGIAGVTVRLTGTDDRGNAVNVTTTTGADGSYSFNSLRPGSYTVAETQPPVYVDGKDTAGTAGGTVTNDTISAINLVSGQQSLNNNFGELKTASLGDKVWFDTDADGQQDANEAGVGGVTVNLLNAGGTVVATQTTQPDGSYLFTNLAPGTYSVQFVAPQGLQFTTRDVGADVSDSDANVDTGRTGSYVLNSGDAITTVDAGLVKCTVDLGDKVWLDANGNGLQDGGEAGVGNVKVTLVGAGADGSFGTADDTQRQTTTDANGNYLFGGVEHGTYKLRFDTPVGYTGFTTANVGADDGKDSDVVTTIVKGTTNLINNGSFESGTTGWTGNGDTVEVNTSGSFGVTGATGAKVAELDANACGLGGFYQHVATTVGQAYQLSVDIAARSGTALATNTVEVYWAGKKIATIDPTSTTMKTYTFDVVGTSTSDRLEFREQAGDDDSLGGIIDNVRLVTCTTVQETAPVIIDSCDDNLTIDAGLLAQKASIGNFIWYDKDADGIQDANEAGIAGVTVELRSNGVNGVDGGSVLATTTTDATGKYLFSNLTPGDYHIDVVESTLPAGFVFTLANQGGNDALDSDVRATAAQPLSWGVMDNTTLAPGENDLSWDAGVYKVGIDVEKYVSGTKSTTSNTGGSEGEDCAYWVSKKTSTGWSGVSGCTGGESFNQIFGCNVYGGSKSIYDCLRSTGTTILEKFMRESVAAYLNACHDKVDYAYSKDQVLSHTKWGVDTGKYDDCRRSYEEENNKGCNWTDSKTRWDCVVDTDLYDADAPPGLEVKAGSTVTFTYIVKNTGDTALKNVVLADDRIATVTYVSGDTDRDGLLDTNESWTYTATEVAQSGTIKNTGTVTAVDSVGGVAQVTDKDDAYYTGTGALKSSLGDRVWEDSNANGVQDTGERGLAGVQVTLTGAGKDGSFGTADDITANTTTGSNGLYAFNNLDAGKYTVKFGTLAGYNLTGADLGGNDAKDSDAIVATRTTGVITLAAGEQNLTVDAGMVGITKLGIDVEKYVSGTVTTTNNHGGNEGGSCGEWVSKCSTTSSWQWVSSGWFGGSWQEVKSPSGWSGISGITGKESFNQIFGCNLSGGSKSIYDVLCSTGTSSAEKMMRESVAAYLNACHSKVDYAYSKEQVVAHTKWGVDTGRYDDCSKSYEQENNKGCDWGSDKTNWSCVVAADLYDADAPPGLEVKTGSTVTFTYIVKNTGDNALKNVVLTDDRIASVTYVSGDTDKDGLLDTNETWTYTAKEVASAGTIKNTGTVTAADANGSGRTVTDQDDAYYTGSGALKSSLGDRVWEDKNGNGVQDSGEAGLSGVKVVLTGAGKDGTFGTKDDITATTTTNANGLYEFNNLDAGKYVVTFQAGAGYVFTKTDQGGNDAKDSDANSAGKTAVITLDANEHDLTVDAGLFRKASVGDKVWEDANHNNVQDAGEAGIGGVTVKLLNASGLVVGTDITDSYGKYLFSNLDPGAYTLQFDKTNVSYKGINMNYWKWAVKDSGANDSIDSDVTGNASSTTNVTVTSQFTLDSGESDMTRDAGITPIVIDLNGNGIQTVARADAQGSFDLFGNGKAVVSGWLSGDDGFLAVDVDGNGKIDSINELFGGNNKGDGFAKLASFDSNGDGLVNDLDSAFGQLLIWRDANGNHASDAGELMSLADAGVASLSTGYTELPQLDAQGNLHLERSTATLADGQSVAMTDVYFNVSAEDAAAAGVNLPTMADLLGNDSSLDSLLGATPQSLGALADCGDAGCQSGGDASEALRRLAALSRESCQVPAAA